MAPPHWRQFPTSPRFAWLSGCDQGTNDYVYAGKRTKLAQFLPEVKVIVLGPPTVKQHAGIRKERARDPDGFWTLQAKALAIGTSQEGKGAPALFQGFEQVTGGQSPPWARWVVRSLRSASGNQLLELVLRLIVQ